ncbi:electron transport complex subunit RsxD [Simiduia agarivorans]|uniref:Ion-translocating oxidoreductase complex subunit D n=1 Tax=Simiduia agarivorans (strain DSM 21679 / JCM 13881 / BCRC 17597 / SA1) TaxID=1117647 RepID=K4KXQ6_SIMAS|nr:electron transport complex subunit RsxD [Simiduia agarivorans]AFU98687.1 electron transport complex protein RnfD [Simiduia agarivorans SA1 = DSM 21679]
MALMRITSPHATGSNRTQKVMLTVCLATLPGLLAMTWFFGVGPIINVVLAGLYAMLWEALVLRLRKRPVGFFLRDGSALLTGILLGLALPPYCPWWLILIGTGFAVAIAKQLYGGLGQNPFNPAMVGYVVLLISFPVAMTQWPLPEAALAASHRLPSLTESISLVFGTGTVADAYTGATPLDAFRQNNGLLVQDLYADASVFAHGQWAGIGFEWVNLGFLMGGLFLLQQRLFTWHAPVGMLGALVLLSAVFYDGGSSNSAGSPLMHLLSGGTMLGAFFIVTDPVTSCTSNRGRLIFGIGVGVLVFCIRTWGNYPDAVAFGVLLMNFAAPFIDYYTPPRTYGHERARSVREKAE